MDPKRLRFSDLGSDSSDSVRSFAAASSVSSSSSESPTISDDSFVLRLSTSFSSISTAPSSDDRRQNEIDDHHDAPSIDQDNKAASSSRHSEVTTTSGTTVWTIHHGSSTTRATMLGAKATSHETTENTEPMDEETTVKLRRRTVGTTLSLDNSSCERMQDDQSVLAAALDHLNCSSPTVPIQRTITISIADDAEELPPTQPSGPLKGVSAFVEVFSGADNRSALIGNVLRDLGATVCQRLTSKVTHVIYREGRQATIERARSRNIHLVSVQWVEGCERDYCRLPESAFAIGQYQKVTPISLKDKRNRAMQPKSLEAELALTDGRIRKRRQRLTASKPRASARKDIRREESSVPRTGGSTSSMITPARDVTFPVRPATTGTRQRWTSDAEDETPESLKRQIADVRKKLMPTGSASPTSRRETLTQSQQGGSQVRKKLFDDDGQVLQDTPAEEPPARRATRSSKGIKRLPSVPQQRQKATTAVRTKLPAPDVANETAKNDSSVNDVVEGVCKKVTTMNIQNEHRPMSSIKRRVFDRTMERISDGMAGVTPDPNEKAGPAAKALTVVRSTRKDTTMDIDDVFTVPSSVLKPKDAKSAKPAAGEMIRLRSSLFEVSARPDGRTSSDDFRTPDQQASHAVKRRNQEPSQNAALHPSSIVVRASQRSFRRPPVRSLVMTNLKDEDRELVFLITKRLKGFRVQNKVTSDTSHIICGEDRRTLNLLMGVARGCWILPTDWVYHSLANGKWHNEEPFEMVAQFPAAHEIRKRKRTSEPEDEYAATCQIFNGMGAFYIAPTSQPPSIDLCSLIRWCGGKVALTSKRASFCVGCAATNEDTVGVKETWILDSIMQHRLAPIDTYLIQ